MQRRAPAQTKAAARTYGHRKEEPWRNLNAPRYGDKKLNSKFHNGVVRARLMRFTLESWLVVQMIALIVCFGAQLGSSNSKSPAFADFISFYRMGQLASSADRTKLYDENVQLSYFNKLNAVAKSSRSPFAQNPPFAFIFLIPFATLPLELSFKVWIALSVICGSLSIALYMSMSGRTRWRDTILISIGALASTPGWLALAVGQTSWFILAFLFIYFWGLLKRRDFFCGLALTLSLCKFQYFPFLLVPLLARGQFKPLAWALVALGVLLLASSMLFGYEVVLHYPLTLFDAETATRLDGVYPAAMISVRGLLSIFLGRKEALIATVVLMLISLVPLFLLWKKFNLPEFDNGQLSFRSGQWLVSVTVIAALVFSPHSHVYDAVFLAIPATCALLVANAREAGSTESLFEVLMRVALCLYPVLSWSLLVATVYLPSIQRTEFLMVDLVLLVLAVGSALSIHRHIAQPVSPDS